MAYSKAKLKSNGGRASPCFKAACITFTFFRLSTLLWLGSCIHCILACFLWSKKLKHNVLYLLTQWCRVLLEQLTGLQLVKDSPHFTEPEGSLPHSQASWTSSIQSIYPHPTSWRSILILSTHLRLGLPSGSFPPVSPPRPYTTRFNIQKFYMVLALRCVFWQILKQTATFALYIIKWLGFKTVVESVYSAVRTDSLYKANYASPLKVKDAYTNTGIGIRGST